MRKISALFVICLCVCTLLLCFPAKALSEQNSLTLHYYATNEALPLANAKFYIYRAAELTEDGSYALTKDFEKYQVDISDLDWNEAGRLTQLAITLSAYATRDEIKPLKMKTTDARGDLTFEGLEDGLYLVFGDTLTIDVGDNEWNFSAQPLLLPLPYPNIGGTDINDMEVDVKYDRFPPPTKDDLVDLTVIKVWKGIEEHPDSITAQLMRDGIITDSAELNEQNNWQHTWKNLNTGYVWQILEKDVPEGYKVSIHQEGYVFTITNTKGDSHPGQESVVTTSPSDISDGSDKRTTNTSTTTSENHSTNSSESRTEYTSSGNNSDITTKATTRATTTDTKLPQTGQLWWPVPLLLGGGVLLFGTGLLLRRKEN